MAISVHLARARAVDATELMDVIDAFIEDRMANVQEKTVYGYNREIAPFRQWWQQYEAIHKFTISQDIFKAFIAWYETDYINSHGEKASIYTLHKTTIRIRHILQWAGMPAHVVDMCPVYHFSEGEKYYPSPDELNRLVSAPIGKERIRDSAFIAFALSTGARRAELISAKTADLEFNTPLSNLHVGDDHSGYIHLRVVKGDSEGTGKGRYSWFCSKAGLLLKAWLRSGGDDAEIFGLGYNAIQNIVRNIAVTTKIPEIHPHAFRSAMIDHWAFERAGAGMMASLALKLQVGHAIDQSEFGATKFYINLSNPWRNLELIKQFHCSPMDNITIDWMRYPVHVG